MHEEILSIRGQGVQANRWGTGQGRRFYANNWGGDNDGGNKFGIYDVQCVLL